LSSKYTQIAANKAYHEAMEAVQQIMAHDPYLLENKVSFKLSYRIKDKYQLFLKMQRKNLSSISQVRDALGMRIVIKDYSRVERETDEAYTERGNKICYHLVDQIRNAKGWVPAIRGFKDYIKNTKENGYKSLHQYIKNGALGTNVEIQVRTEAMHVFSQLGEAAHWLYKDKMYQPKLVDTKIYRHAWRSPQQAAAKSQEELIAMARSQLLASRVLVFLEDRSTVLNLMKGDTALDATFAVHSELGLSVTAIRIGGRKVPLDYTLQNGDVVTCESSPSITVDPLWLDFVKSPNALSKIRKHFRENDRQVLICCGLVQLLMSLTQSEKRVTARWPRGLPDVVKLAEYIKMRTPSSITNFPEFLERLGGSSDLSESASLIGSLLDIPMKHLSISSVPIGLFWCRMEDRNGFEDKEMQKNLLLPILDKVSTLGHPDIRAVWVHLIGSRSLQLEDKPATLIPLEALLTTTLGPSRKVYKSYTSVTQAPESAMTPTPSSSIPQEYSSKVREEWPGVSKSLLTSAAREEEKTGKAGLKIRSAITITMKPAHVQFVINRGSSVMNVGSLSYTGQNLVKRSSADYTHSRRN
jgi:ppGpp synthetase/RelA/SpoT-type nucleotidyltranferase